MVADPHRRNIRTHRLDDPGAFMAKHERAIEREPSQPVHDMQVTVTHAGRDGAYQHLAAPRLVQVHLLDRQRLMHFAKHGGGRLHRFLRYRNLAGRYRIAGEPPMAGPPLLFTPITLRGITARNRIVVSPMCQYVSVDGAPTDWQFVHFGRYAMGGAGIVFGEETAVEARGRKTYHCAGIWNDHQVKAYRRTTDFIKEMGALPAIQIGHCGRNAGSHGAMEDWRALDERDARAGMPPWRGLAPSPLPARRGFPVPIEMDHDDIRTVLAAWREAAKRATDAGYDVCEIHGAHGYLIHQFLSPISNRRTDTYGGSRENRMRFALEVAETVRAAWPRIVRCSSASPRWMAKAACGAWMTRSPWRAN